MVIMVVVVVKVLVVVVVVTAMVLKVVVTVGVVVMVAVVAVVVMIIKIFSKNITIFFVLAIIRTNFAQNEDRFFKKFQNCETQTFWKLNFWSKLLMLSWSMALL